MSKIPSGDVLESLYKLRIRESDQFKIVLESFEMEIHQEISMPDYQKLKTMVKRSIDQKLRLQNFDARQGKIETGAVVNNRKGLSGVEGGRGTCCRWKEKGQCSKGDQRTFRHESDDRAPKPTPKATPLSEPSMTQGRSESRKRSVRGRSQTGRTLRQPCKYYLKGTCSRSLCESWHLRECQFYKTKSGCKAGDKCLFPHCKVEEQPSTKPKKSFNSQNGKGEDKGAIAIMKTVPQLGCVSQDSEPSRLLKGVKYLGNPRQKVLRSIRRVRFTKSTLRQAIIGENKGTSLGKRQSQKSSSAKTLTL